MSPQRSFVYYVVAVLAAAVMVFLSGFVVWKQRQEGVSERFGGRGDSVRGARCSDLRRL